MKTFFEKKKNVYVFMLERGLDDLNRVQTRNLESELLNLNGISLGKGAILDYRKDGESQLIFDPLLLKGIINHQAITGLIHGGIYEFKYRKYSVYITDGIPPSRFLKMHHKIYNNLYCY